jgi:hypothetical protein
MAGNHSSDPTCPLDPSFSCFVPCSMCMLLYRCGGVWSRGLLSQCNQVPVFLCECCWPLLPSGLPSRHSGPKGVLVGSTHRRVVSCARLSPLHATCWINVYYDWSVLILVHWRAARSSLCRCCRVVRKAGVGGSRHVRWMLAGKLPWCVVQLELPCLML